MITCVVIDAGLAFKLLVPNPQRDQLKQLVRQWTRDKLTLCAPSLWLYELTCIMTKMVHFGHLDEADAQDSLALVNKLGVRLIPPDEEQTQRAFAWTRLLGRPAAYDSFYLAAAETLNCELWTLDQRLANAVNCPWVRLAREK